MGSELTVDKPMRQLVFQLPEDFFPTFDEMVAFEDLLIASLPRTATVDGHDIGSGTINFFVETRFVESAFRAFRKYLGTNKVERKLRVAYRLVDGEEWTELWPRRPKRGQKPFAYLYR